MVPLEYFNTLEDEADQFTYVRLEAMGKAQLSSPDSWFVHVEVGICRFM